MDGHDSTIPQRTIDRFWSRVEAGRGQDECWPWVGPLRGNGYGVIFVNGRQVGAHRFAWRLANGPIPPGLSILHRCDNRVCCNPGHLFTGTAADNVADMVAKGRNRGGRGESHGSVTRPERVPRGERHGNALITEAIVTEMRIRRAMGESGRSLALEFGIHPTTAQEIIRGAAWGHVKTPTVSGYFRRAVRR